MQAERVIVSRKFLGHFEEKVEGFRWSIVIGDETWVPHCDTVNKRQSMVYCHTGSLAQNKFCCKSWVDCILELWTHWLLGKGAIVNSERYTENLKNLKSVSWGRGQKWMMSCFSKTIPGLTQVLPSDAIACLGCTVLPYPVYNLHLSPSDFQLFSKPKEDLRG